MKMKFKKNERHHQEKNSFLRNLAREETLEFKLGCFFRFYFHYFNEPYVFVC